MDLNSQPSLPPTQFGGMPPKKIIGKVLIIIFFVLLLMITFVFVAFLLVKSGIDLRPYLEDSMISTPTVSVENLVYTNEKFGYQITLPKGFRIAKKVSAVMAAARSIERKYFDKELPNFDFGEQAIELNDFRERHSQERLIFENEWNEKQSEILFLTNISEQDEENIKKINFKTPPPVVSIYLDIFSESSIDITKAKEKETEYAIYKKITLNNGYQALYIKFKNSQYKSMIDSILIYIPITNKNNVGLINDKIPGVLGISMELSPELLSEEKFLEFVNSLKLL